MKNKKSIDLEFANRLIQPMIAQSIKTLCVSLRFISGIEKVRNLIHFFKKRNRNRETRSNSLADLKIYEVCIANVGQFISMIAKSHIYMLFFKPTQLHMISYLLLFPSISLQGMDNQILLATIFTPAPLLELHHKNTKEDGYIAYLKKAAIPLTCCFCYTIKKNDIWTDITENPYTSSIFMYTVTHYFVHLILQNQKNKIDQEIINMMQHIFHFLIIGHGIYNKITTPSYSQYKSSIAINSTTLSTLQLFLNNAYNTWFILFSYYQEHYKNKPLYAYHMNQIDLFETLQASTHEPDILPLITKFYDKNNTTYDYEPILNCLEIKLKLINHKLKTIFPD
jgi:hypothetical protein